ncbi:hypothetical protein CEP54_009256 [Fusarium duplospermum]|uniref:Uncharacterized protein n=1 Tax=Fusarium duplospermum TaxID=1325734 RepID=A0A428PS09_9HYPO|nr:hypothetical protein CEP54_009256 [Fusarium duplospermum]
MVHLLHSMYKAAMRAIVAGTVVYDGFKDRAAWLKTSSEVEGKIPGVSVMGMSREGQQGQFLNINETQRLFDGLERYVKGGRICLQNRNAAVAPAMSNIERAAVSWIHTVDPFVGSAAPPGAQPLPRFIQSDSKILSIEGVIEGFKLRCNRTLDPSGKVRQIQSPLCMGCSTDLRARTSACKRTVRRGLVNLNKPLYLVANTLEALKLPVDLSMHVALRICEADQLPLAEQLIITIALSLVHQCGFNATESGGTGSSTVNPTSASLRQNIELIMAHSNTMEQNIRAMLADLAQRRKLLVDIDRLTDH